MSQHILLLWRSSQVGVPEILMKYTTCNKKRYFKSQKKQLLWTVFQHFLMFVQHPFDCLYIA